jgi:hypothetical protein
MSEKLENKKYIASSSIIIFFISIIFALLIGSGLYGYGIDYYSGYSKGFEFNKLNATFFNYLGYKVATLTINGFHIGVYIVTFILSLSTGFLIRECIKFKQSYSLIFFLLTFLIAIHTWPIIMSTSNAMRQGLTMSFIFLALISSFRKNYYWMLFLCFVAIFMHGTGPLLAIIIVFSTILNKLLTIFSHKSKVIINFLIGTFLSIITYYFVNTFFLPNDHQPSRIIAGDFRWHFVFIGFIYVILSFFYRSILANSFTLSLYFYSFISFSFLMNGLNWEYERLGMMMLIPYIFSFGIILNRVSYKIYLILFFLLLLLLTIYQDMYTVGLT